VEDSVYIHRDHQGQGIGKLILADLVARAQQHGFHTIIGRIVGGHDASIGLHRSLGFDHVGVEREIGRKFGKWLDVVVMQRML
jgi:phosphinothricin acetyltransferase